MISFLILISLALTPLVTFAAPSDFAGFVALILDLIAVTIPVFVGLAVLFFVWGLAKIILKSGDTKSHTEGKQFIMWSIVAMFVMVSVWGLIVFAKGELEFGGGIGIPLLPVN